MFEDFHQVRYTQGALEAAAELSARYINERFLPDKAIDVMDEAGAAQRILPKSKQKKSHRQSANRNRHCQSCTDSRKNRIARRQTSAAIPRPRFEKHGLRSGKRHRHAGCRRQNVALRPCPTRQAHRQFPLLRPDRRRKTEVAKQLAYSMGVPLQRSICPNTWNAMPYRASSVRRRATLALNKAAF